MNIFEHPSPQNITPEESIKYFAGMVTIDLLKIKIPFTRAPLVWICPVPDTNSMDPVFDAGNHNILIAGADEENMRILCDFIKVGDIAVYEDYKSAIHRVIQISKDKQGRYFRFRGDNNPIFPDAVKVRDSGIRWLSIGTIY